VIVDTGRLVVLGAVVTLRARCFDVTSVAHVLEPLGKTPVRWEETVAVRHLDPVTIGAPLGIVTRRAPLANRLGQAVAVDALPPLLVRERDPVAFRAVGGDMARSAPGHVAHAVRALPTGAVGRREHRRSLVFRALPGEAGRMAHVARVNVGPGDSMTPGAIFHERSGVPTALGVDSVTCPRVASRAPLLGEVRVAHTYVRRHCRRQSERVTLAARSLRRKARPRLAKRRDGKPPDRTQTVRHYTSRARRRVALGAPESLVSGIPVGGDMPPVAKSAPDVPPDRGASRYHHYTQDEAANNKNGKRSAPRVTPDS